jgi:hypothetical protein
VRRNLKNEKAMTRVGSQRHSKKKVSSEVSKFTEVHTGTEILNKKLPNL